MTARRRRTAAGATLTALVLAGASGCGAATSGGDSATGGTGRLTVFAAASLTEAFTAIGEEFTAANPGVRVSFSFAGSSTLATQLNQGAPADVFASAAPANMTTVVEAGNVAGAPVVFARNQLVIAVPEGNPDRVTGLADLARPGMKVALCATPVPCGAAARQALDAAGVRLTPVTLERDVKAALAKVRIGEVDAALVYRTDVPAADDEVDGIEFPEAVAARTDYLIAVLADAPNPDAARAFVAHVRSATGQAVLTRAGFQVA